MNGKVTVAQFVMNKTNMLISFIIIFWHRAWILETWNNI